MTMSTPCAADLNPDVTRGDSPQQVLGKYAIKQNLLLPMTRSVLLGDLSTLRRPGASTLRVSLVFCHHDSLIMDVGARKELAKQV